MATYVAFVCHSDLFLTTPSFGDSGRLCFVIGYLHLYIKIQFQKDIFHLFKTYANKSRDAGSKQDQNLADIERASPLQLLSNFNGSNIYGTMEICSRHGKFEPLRVNHSARSNGNLDNSEMSFRSSTKELHVECFH